jgi:hypothetical protein
MYNTIHTTISTLKAFIIVQYIDLLSASQLTIVPNIPKMPDPMIPPLPPPPEEAGAIFAPFAIPIH